jgi:deazaflavin-dependent oxidoreductase (nitroreductase family)
MEARVRSALEHRGMAELTTIGRRSGRPRRVPVAFFNVDGRIYVSGRPGFPRGWMANLQANPRFTFGLRRPVTADLDAEARPITDLEERRRILPTFAEAWGYSLDRMVAGSPLIEVTFPESTAPEL